MKLGKLTEYSEPSWVIASLDAMKKEVPSPPSPPPKLKDEQGNEIEKYDDLLLIEWKDKNSLYKKQENMYANKMTTIGKHIYDEWCSPDMKSKLRAEPDFDVIKNDPLKLLPRIRTFQIQGSNKEHPFDARLKAVKDALFPVQGENERLANFLKRVEGSFKQIEDVALVVCTPEAEKLPEYELAEGLDDEEMMDTIVTQQCTKLMARVCVKGLIPGQYGSYQTDLAREYAADGTDRYPADLASIRDTLSSEVYKPTQEWKDAQKAKQKKLQAKPTPQFDPGKKGEGGLTKAVLWQANQKGEFCYACGSPDHKLPQCKVKGRMQNKDWAVNQMEPMKKQFFQLFHQHYQWTQTAAAPTPAPAPAPVPAPRSTPPAPIHRDNSYYQQPTGSAIGADDQSHRSGFTQFTPIPPALQATFQQFPTSTTPAPAPTPTPPARDMSSFRFHPNLFQMEKSFGVEETSFTGVHDAPPISAAEAEDIITFLDTGATISSDSKGPAYHGQHAPSRTTH